MASDLLPCPFCGSKAVEIELREPDGYVRETLIRCDNCAIEQAGEYTAEAIAAWNTRDGIVPPAPDALAAKDAEIARYRKELRAVLEWALSEKAPLREQELSSIRAALTPRQSDPQEGKSDG